MGFIQRALRQTVDNGDEKLQLMFLSVFFCDKYNKLVFKSII